MPLEAIMWMLFGAASKKKPIRGGLQTQRWCPECKAEQTFVECEIEDKVDIFFIPVLQGKSRHLVCSECGEELEQEATPKAAPKRTVSEPKRTFTDEEKD